MVNGLGRVDNINRKYEKYFIKGLFVVLWELVTGREYMGRTICLQSLSKGRVVLVDALVPFHALQPVKFRKRVDASQAEGIILAINQELFGLTRRKCENIVESSVGSQLVLNFNQE